MFYFFAFLEVVGSPNSEKLVATNFPVTWLLDVLQSRCFFYRQTNKDCIAVFQMASYKCSVSLNEEWFRQEQFQLSKHIIHPIHCNSSIQCKRNGISSWIPDAFLTFSFRSSLWTEWTVIIGFHEPVEHVFLNSLLAISSVIAVQSGSSLKNLVREWFIA